MSNDKDILAKADALGIRPELDIMTEAVLRGGDLPLDVFERALKKMAEKG